MMSKCKACGANIKWVETKYGKIMPLDAKPRQMILVKEEIGEAIEVYMPHWATCPGAGQFRKKGIKK